MTLWSRFFIPTLKESPADAEIASHRLLVRAGLVRKLSGGLYTYLPLGLRVMHKLTQVCREELDAAGAIELLMPYVHPAENWEQGPRWAAAREIMFRADSAGSGRRAPAEPELVLGPTHEEVITPFVKTAITSYRDLPKNFYQIGTKFRNEIRPRYGLMRAREFVMMDAYSFDVSDEAAITSYFAMKAAYERFFQRIGLTAIAVEADTGVMGGSFSHEFMVPAEVGDDDIIYNEASGYAANREKATSAIVPADLVDAAPIGPLETFPTPGVTTIAALEAEPYGVAASAQFKTLVYVGDGRPFVVILRGSDELEEAKLGALGFAVVRPAEPAEIEPVMGANPGSLGAVAGTIREPSALVGVFADHAIRLIGNGVTGANRDGFHLRQVNVRRDLAITAFGDFRRVRPGEPDPKSGQPLQVRRGIEVGHIFKLGTKYSEAFGAAFTDDQKQSHFMVMGCYGIGISRTLQAIVEQRHDDNGIAWPWAVAPFHVLIVVLDPQIDEAMTLARSLADAAGRAGADVLVDDRVERPGVKFKDADLIGIPLRVTIGGKGLKDGIVELKARTSADVERVPVAEAGARLAAVVAAAAS
ncbi:MAG: proline--tRNA ligase [Acidobacteria bacterium SCN 69-37]|nr:MAG: proline--tRNA ligase [Acidobacteria bacterium SCN 69-37]